MKDLFDIAKPVRDAAVRETLRALSDDTNRATRDGGELAAHLVAVLMAWGRERHQVTAGVSRMPDLLDSLGYALGLMLGNAGMIYRPAPDGVGIPMSQAVGQMLGRAVPVAMDLARRVELGSVDVSLPIGVQPDGTLGVERFDLLARSKP